MPSSSQISPCTTHHRDARDYILYAALALLPVDGLIFGFQMPYWSPVSPLLFLLYTCTCWRQVRNASHTYPAVAPFLFTLLLVSIFGWATIGVNLLYLVRTVIALLCAVSTLFALHIAFTLRNISIRTAISILVTTYWIAFLVGVFTWLGQPNHLHWSWSYPLLSELYLRQYFIFRPQFLFAEPSYIGMHIFGVLLPLYWLSRDRRLIILIITFAVGSIVMGAGVRVLLDTIVALILSITVLIPWKKVRRSPRMVGGTAVVSIMLITAGIAAMLTNSRMQSLLYRGIFSGDVSMSARIFRSLAPLEALLHNGWHTIFGFGAGNIGTAIAAGYSQALNLYTHLGGIVTGEITELKNPFGPTLNRAGNVFTMNAYVSFATEFGVPMLIIGIALVIHHIAKHHAWDRTTICWLILITYLYTQFEAYAFYAFPLFIWAIGSQHSLQSRLDCSPASAVIKLKSKTRRRRKGNYENISPCKNNSNVIPMRKYYASSPRI